MNEFEDFEYEWRLQNGEARFDPDAVVSSGFAYDMMIVERVIEAHEEKWVAALVVFDLVKDEDSIDGYSVEDCIVDEETFDTQAEAVAWCQQRDSSGMGAGPYSMYDPSL